MTDDGCQKRLSRTEKIVNRKLKHMFQSSLKLIFRNWWRNKTFTLISILSLTVGIACTALLISFVSYENGIEKSNPNRDKLVWVIQTLPTGTRTGYMHKGAPEQMKGKYPEVEDFLQLNSFGIQYVEVYNQRFENFLILNVDASFPTFFPFDLAYGSWKSLENPQSIIISEKQAEKLFGKKNAVGEQVTVSKNVSGKEITTVYNIGGVVKTRRQSAVTFDGLICNPVENWGGPTLLMMSENANLAQFEEKVKNDKIPTLAGGQYFLIPLDEAISTSYNSQELTYWHLRNESLLFVGLISAVLVLVIAVFNYANLSFSRVLQQIKTLHVQKLMGAKTTDVQLQIFLDTFLAVFISFILAVLMMHDILPAFNQLVSVDFSPEYFYSKDFFPLLVLMVFLLAVIPSLFLVRKISRMSGSSYRMFFITRKNRWVGALVTVQFVIAIALIIAAITAIRQVELVKSNGDRYRDMIEIGDVMGEKPIAEFGTQLKNVNGIREYSFGYGGLMSSYIMYNAIQKKNGEKTESEILLLGGDKSLFNTLQLTQIAGEDWETSIEKYPNPVFVNKSLADLADVPPADMIGTRLRNYVAYDSIWVVAGVVEDFYLNSLEKKAYPALVKYIDKSENYNNVYIRLGNKNDGDIIQNIKQAWEKVYPQDFLHIGLSMTFSCNATARFLKCRACCKCIRSSAFCSSVLGCLE